MAFCVRCCRYLLLVSSFLLPIGGVLEASWAGWWAWRVLPHRQLFSQSLLWPPALLVAVAISTGLTSYLLWRATNARRLFGVVAVCVWLGALCVSQGVLCVWSLVLRYSLPPPTDAMLTALLTGSPSISWDTLQPQLQCCAAVGPGDYRAVDPTRLPTSCCVPAGPHQGHCEAVFQRGCAQPLADALGDLAATSAAVAGAAAAATLSILVIAAFYAAEIRKRTETTAEPADVQQTLLRNLRPRDG
ncbi:uncharacterized protein LOC126248635 [Schistocerca nitens]|uniref:uncharacterized protein LOC126248635 n=1 Tax=Schistocerca nitens TaxID=7011 RepID=UPI002118F144|nr:uncharacterized protein LOC126248635 [Schistocerca nitens]